MGGIWWQAKEVNPESVCFLNEIDAHVREVPIIEKDNRPSFEEVLNSWIELLLRPLEVVVLFHPARFTYPIAGGGRTPLSRYCTGAFLYTG